MSDVLYQQAVDAIKAVFNDRSKARAEAISDLESLEAECEVMIDALRQQRGLDDE